MAARAHRLAGDATAAALGVVTALVVVWPLLSGTVLLLDWSVGSRSPLWPPAADGLDGGLTAGLPFQIGVAALAHLTDAAGWLVPAAVFPIGAVGIARLVGGSAPARIAAVLLYDVNPFVFDRLSAGQIAFLFGYALLPFGARAAFATSPGPVRDHVRGAVPVAVWWAVLTGCSVHFAWIYGALVVARAFRGRISGRAAGLITAVVGLALSSAYLVVPPAGQERPVSISDVDLVAYRTQGDQHVGLLGNLLGLNGFWRRGVVVLPKQELHVWWLVLAPIVAVILIGIRAALHDERRSSAFALIGCGVAGLLVSLGDQGSTGPAFRFVFDHVGPFQVMREPQKALALLALLYAVAFGWGAEVIWRGGNVSTVLAAIAPVVLLLPLAYTPTMGYGLRNQIHGSHVPASFAQANALMGDGPERVLFLPWHEYESFPWTRQIVTNPGQLLFDRPTIIGDDVELPQVTTTSSSTRSHFLEYLYASSSNVHAFGALVAPMGIKFVVVAKTLDWREYDWLRRQRDLTVALETPDLVLFRNDSAVDVGHRVTALETVPDWGALVALANTGRDISDVEVARPVAGPVVLPDTAPSAPRGQLVTRRSRTTFDVPAGTGPVVLSEPYAAGWRGPHGTRPIDLGTGAMAVDVGDSGGSFQFTHRTQAWASELVSIVSFGALVGISLAGVGLFSRWGRIRRNKVRHSDA